MAKILNNIEHVVIKTIVMLYEDKQIQKANEASLELKTEFFSKHACIKIATAFKQLIKQNKPLDRVTVINTIDTDIVPAFGEIMSCQIDILKADNYINILKDAYKKREIKKALDKASRDLELSIIDNPPERIISSLRADIEKIDMIKNSEVEDIEKVLYDSWSDLEESTKDNNLKELEKWKTGINGLDNLLGGLRRKQLTLIGAHSGIGKTALALQIGLNLTSNGLRGFVVSKEMDSKELVRRMISNLRRIDSNKFKWLKLDENDWKSILDGHHQLARNKFTFDTKSQTVSDIERWIKRLKPDFTIIDYIQLLTPENKSESREQQISGISRNLKRIAMAEDTSIILLTQLNENEATGRPSERSIRESRGPYFDSDNVIFIYRPKPEILEKYVDENYSNLKIDSSHIKYASDSKMDFVEIILDKQRNGATGAFMAANKKPYYLFETIGGSR